MCAPVATGGSAARRDAPAVPALDCGCPAKPASKRETRQGRPFSCSGSWAKLLALQMGPGTKQNIGVHLTVLIHAKCIGYLLCVSQAGGWTPMVASAMGTPSVPCPPADSPRWTGFSPTLASPAAWLTRGGEGLGARGCLSQRVSCFALLLLLPTVAKPSRRAC